MTPPFRYQVLGLELESEIPLYPEPAATGIELGLPKISLRAARARPRFEHVEWQHQVTHPLISHSLDHGRLGTSFVLRVPDLFGAVVTANGLRAEFWSEGVDDLELGALVSSQLVPAIAFRVHGGPVLHAAALARNGRAALFFGNHGAGKSTLTKALAETGWTVLSDDVVALEQGLSGEIFALPGAAECRLETESEVCLREQGKATPPPLRGFGKLRWPFQARGVKTRVGALYFLDETAIDAEALNGSDTLALALASCFRLGIFQADRQLARELDLLTKLIAQAPATRLRWKRGLSELPEQAANFQPAWEAPEPWIRKSQSLRP